MKQPHPPEAWAYVFACEGSAGTCSNADDVCEPALPTPPSPAFMWTYCVSLEDPTKSCPTSFPIERDFGNGWTDVPTCAPCTCSAPEGSACSPSIVTVYSDPECSNEVGSVEAQTLMSTCSPIPSASSLGSIAATPSMYTPGACTHAGGVVIGGPPVTANPMTFCCEE